MICTYALHGRLVWLICGYMEGGWDETCTILAFDLHVGVKAAVMMVFLTEFNVKNIGLYGGQPYTPPGVV